MSGSAPIVVDSAEKKMKEEKKEEKKKEKPANTDTTEEPKEEENSMKSQKKSSKESPPGTDEGDMSDEEPPLGLLEGVTVAESGKHERSKVERLSKTMSFIPQQKEEVVISEGTGTKLGDCPRIEYKLQRATPHDLEDLHRLLFNRPGMAKERKANIRQFCGFTFQSGDKQYQTKMVNLSKKDMRALTTMCDTLDLKRSGRKTEVVQRILEFLLHPSSSGSVVPRKKKQGNAISGKKAKGVKRKKADKNEIKRKKIKSKEYVEMDSDDSEEEEYGGKDEPEDKQEEEEAFEGKSEEELPTKKTQMVPKKSKADEEKPTKKEPENNEKREKPKKKFKRKKIKSREYVETDSDDSEEEEDGGKDEPEDKQEEDDVKKNEPPSDDELKDAVEEILAGVNWEIDTLNMVFKQVCAKYSSFDLSGRKKFVKETAQAFFRRTSPVA